MSCRTTCATTRNATGPAWLHNYFILKSLHLTKPGGIVAVLTSRYTLDSRNASARHQMATLADLVGAVRLPAGAFAESAGTNVVADILILRRRGNADAPSTQAWPWLASVPLEPGADPVLCNELLVAHPELVAGSVVIGSGMYRAWDLTVEPSGDLGASLRAALGAVVKHARDVGLTFDARPETGLTADAHHPPTAVGGAFVIDGGGFARIHGHRHVRYAPRVRGDSAELRRLIALRDAARGVLDAQTSGAPDDALAERQRVLTDRYRDYQRAHGPLNRFTLAKTGRTDPDSGDDVTRRIRPRMGGFRDDPDWPLVAALEVFDDDTQHAVPRRSSLSGSSAHPCAAV